MLTGGSYLLLGVCVPNFVASLQKYFVLKISPPFLESWAPNPREPLIIEIF